MLRHNGNILLPKAEGDFMNKPLLEDKALLTVEEAAALFGLSRRKMFRLTDEDNLPFMAMYGKRKLVIKDEFLVYLSKPGIKEDLANSKPRTKKRFKT